MSAVQIACIANRNGDGNGFLDEVVDGLNQAFDANGDPVKNGNGLKAASSSDEDIASCSSKEDEKDEIIHLKTR